MAESRLALTEPAVILDTFVSGVGDVEEIAPNLFRVTYYTKQKDAYSGEPSLVVVAKFIATAETLAAMGAATAERSVATKESLGLPALGTLN
jgi:hypothetical protein